MTKEQAEMLNGICDAALHGTPMRAFTKTEEYFLNKFMDALAAGTVTFKQVS